MAPEGPDDEAARLYDSHGVSLYRYALMILGSREAAEDVIQQVFVAVVRGSARKADAPLPYLRTAVRNASYSALRQRLVRQSAAPLSEDALLEDVPSPSLPVSQEDRLALSRAIRELPAEQREVLHLHVFEGLTFKEIAEATGDPANTVASRYRYALGKLKAMLSGTTR
jgi:RNA polymerase sigma-70 factor, ECF subfamily